MTAIAIDGPAGAGKSTVARTVADRLGFTYVDTGAMYRALAFYALEKGVDPGDEEATSALAEAAGLELRDGRVLLDGRDVSGHLRTPEVTAASAAIAVHAGVRRALVRHQQRIAAQRDVVMEGRDIGTQVLPDAAVKVFLTASLDERAARRGREAGVSDDVELEGLRESIAQRDERDSRRSISPLTQAPDAVIVDSTGKSIDEVVDEVVALAKAAS